MLRFGLLGGSRPSVPWEFYVTIGSALLAAAGLFALLFPLWSTLPVAGAAESAVFVLAGGILLGIGIRRRKGTAHQSPGRLPRT